MTFDYYQNRAGNVFDGIITKYIVDYNPNNNERDRYTALSKLYGKVSSISTVYHTILIEILKGLGVIQSDSYLVSTSNRVTIKFPNNVINNIAIHWGGHDFGGFIVRLLYSEKYHIRVTVGNSPNETSIKDMINEKCSVNIRWYWLLNNIVDSCLVADLFGILVRLVVFDLE